MGTVTRFKQEKLITGILLAPSIQLESVRSALSSNFGPVDLEKGPFPFGYTDYYREEMGGSLARYFLSFRDLIDPSELSSTKCITNSIEDEFTVEEKRRVNIDPGLISLERLVLASTKDNGRRIPLRSGIYGEITLIYVFGNFSPLPWTYPDYESDEYRAIMHEIRNNYRLQLKQLA